MRAVGGERVNRRAPDARHSGPALQEEESVLRRLVRQEDGQDLVECSLLLAFIVLVGVASYIGIADNVNFIWTVVNSRLYEANQIVN